LGKYKETAVSQLVSFMGTMLDSDVLSDVDSARNIMDGSNNIASSILGNLVAGQSAVSVTSDNLKLSCQVFDFTSEESSKSISVEQTDDEIEYGRMAPAAELGDSLAGISDLEVSLGEFMSDPYAQAYNISNSTTTSSVVRLSISGLSSDSRRRLAEASLSFTVTLQNYFAEAYSDSEYYNTTANCSSTDVGTKYATCGTNTTVPYYCYGDVSSVDIFCMEGGKQPRCKLWDGEGWDFSSCYVTSFNSTTTVCNCTVDYSTRRRLSGSDGESIDVSSDIEALGSELSANINAMDDIFTDPSVIAENYVVFTVMGAFLFGVPLLAFLGHRRQVSKNAKAQKKIAVVSLAKAASNNKAFSKLASAIEDDQNKEYWSIFKKKWQEKSQWYQILTDQRNVQLRLVVLTILMTTLFTLMMWNATFTIVFADDDSSSTSSSSSDTDIYATVKRSVYVAMFSAVIQTPISLIMVLIISKTIAIPLPEQVVPGETSSDCTVHEVQEVENPFQALPTVAPASSATESTPKNKEAWRDLTRHHENEGQKPQNPAAFSGNGTTRWEDDSDLDNDDHKGNNNDAASLSGDLPHWFYAAEKNPKVKLSDLEDLESKGDARSTRSSSPVQWSEHPSQPEVRKLRPKAQDTSSGTLPLGKDLAPNVTKGKRSKEQEKSARSASANEDHLVYQYLQDFQSSTAEAKSSAKSQGEVLVSVKKQTNVLGRSFSKKIFDEAPSASDKIKGILLKNMSSEYKIEDQEMERIIEERTEKLMDEYHDKESAAKKWVMRMISEMSFFPEEVAHVKMRNRVLHAHVIEEKVLDLLESEDELEADLLIMQTAIRDCLSSKEKTARKWFESAKNEESSVQNSDKKDDSSGEDNKKKRLTYSNVKIRHIIGWTIIILYCTFCAYYICAFGINHGASVANQWLYSYFTSQLQQALLNLPLKLAFLYVLFPRVYPAKIHAKTLRTLQSYAPSVQIAERYPNLRSSQILLNRANYDEATLQIERRELAEMFIYKEHRDKSKPWFLFAAFALQLIVALQIFALLMMPEFLQETQMDLGNTLGMNYCILLFVYLHQSLGNAVFWIVFTLVVVLPVVCLLVLFGYQKYQKDRRQKRKHSKLIFVQ